MEDSKYEIDRLKKEVRSYVAESNIKKQELLNIANSKIDNIMTGFGDENETVISFKELLMFKIGVRNELNDGVFFEKTYQDENKIIFMTYMLSGGGFGVHSHDCIEICKVQKGNLIERTRGYRVYEEGSTVIYAPQELHRPYSTKESLYEVTFYRKL